MSYQRIIIIGNVGSDARLSYTQDGTPVTTFSVATNETHGSGDDRKKTTTWWRVTAWRKLAEVCNEYLSKGKTVLVEGVMKPDADTGGPRVWTADDGKPRASYELTAQIVRFIGGGKSDKPATATGDDSLPF